ncbi:hypothetical protein M3212_19195 [Alkalihalobacillus oceani]|uniref:hypothetical protein n=1 Tax=Halalkalibacter oceani TaxID=1653776 RepID=UPI0020410CB8|nr:hypothetical protein [Halalkalibacter oceani]MCM3762871.1 hypothetical protein [Halalkalibacter oceani]
MEMARILFPLIVVAGIAAFVIKRLQAKHKQGTLGQKKSKSAQSLLDSLIPLGMLAGTAISVIVSMFVQIPFLSIISLGAGAGLLVGYFAYEMYSRKE